MSNSGAAVGTATLSVAAEIKAYVLNIRLFGRSDWLRYTCWMATIFSLFFATATFVLYGYFHGVTWPGYVWFVPIGSFLFSSALALDDIGHRTVYKLQLKKGEAYVHQMIVGTAVPSVVTLCFCYDHPQTFRMVALGLTILSFFYSAIDEALHWHRYLTRGVDRVEMWSHFVAIFGHVVMIAAWWQWFGEGYPGVTETLTKLFHL